MSDQKNPLQMLFYWADRHPDKPFMFQAKDGQWSSLSWGQVADQVKGRARNRLRDFRPRVKP